MAFDGIDSGDLTGGSGGFIQTSAHKTGRFQVIFEEIAEGLFVGWVELDGLFEVLARLTGMCRRGERAGSFGAAAEGAAEPEFEVGIGGIGSDGFFKVLSGLFVFALHVMATADPGIDGAVFGLDVFEDFEGVLVIGELVELSGLIDVGGGVGQKRETE